MQNKQLSSIMAGLILFMFTAVYSLVINFGKLQGNQAFAWISYSIIILGIMLFVIRYANDNHGTLSFGNLFAYGFKTTATVAVLFIIFMLIFYMLFPEYKEQLFEISRQKALINAKAEDKERIEKGMEMFKKFFYVGLIAGITFSYAILGAIGSLIGASVSKKNQPYSEELDEIK
jgi:uncharacterized membrane protein YphA (DoxX/SURF4 family)